MGRAFEMRASSSVLPLSASFPLQGKHRQEVLLLDRISKALISKALVMGSSMRYQMLKFCCSKSPRLSWNDHGERRNEVGRHADRRHCERGHRDAEHHHGEHPAPCLEGHLAQHVDRGRTMVPVYADFRGASKIFFSKFWVLGIPPVLKH